MKTNNLIIASPGRTLIAGAPEGYDGAVLAELARARSLLHVARDDARAARLAAALAFFAPEVEVVSFPAWDCLPYDRVSPHRDIVSRRIDALTALAAPAAKDRPRIVIATVAALLQRVPAREFFADATLDIGTGARIEIARLAGFLERSGYARAETVSEAGEYALRGGIVDLFPPGATQPLRVDFFGDEIERIRGFDPLTQRSANEVARFTLKPVSEIRLDRPAIERFRTGYREAFGAGSTDDPIYESISAGRMFAGMEHWLALFHPRLETLLDYLPDAAVSLDYQAEETRDARLEMIADFYRARAEFERADRLDGTAYRPLPPNRLYLDAAEWGRLLAERAVGVLSPFAAPATTGNAIDAGGRPGAGFAEARAQPSRVYDAVLERIAAEQRHRRRVIVAGFSAGSLDRLAHLLADHGLARGAPAADWPAVEKLALSTAALVTLPLDNGFVAPGMALITEQDILGERLARPSKAPRRPEQFLADLANYGAGDYVVHVDHGIGRYEGLETLEVAGAPHDCLRLIYDGGDKLYLPVENIEVLSRYGAADAMVALDKLGGVAWQGRKARVKERLQEIAGQLIRTAAMRALKPGPAMQAPEGLYQEFCARFPYPETEDQTRAIAEVLTDLAAGRPMDRLICGDVGFGKTEVALRAAFVAAMSGHQVALVAPTTLLCRQHVQTFRDRFAGLPVRIGHLSRLVGSGEAKQTKSALRSGQLDIVVGTHALLGKSIAFHNLGLLIVDEEQHFGVAQKELLKDLRAEIHVLTLTATPIPRTLQMALAGVREMSLIATPPIDRLAVRTFVLPYDSVVVREAILREHLRGGQSFYVCPRIEDLPAMADRLAKLVPEVKLAVVHGRMPARELEKAMTAFYDGGYRLLLCTNIIESGLDIPTANTIVIHRAEMFGLADLYQLRGRIGRAKMRGYAYLTVPPGRLLSEAAQKRLKVMQTLDQLGAGFTLASHDLDIRGAGNLLGEEQSGQVREVGVELYQHMLEQAVAELRGQAAPETWTPQIAVGTPVLIPESYVADLGVRLGLYRRLAGLVEPAEIDAFAAELGDRFGSPPVEVDNLLRIIAIKQLCRTAGVEKVEAGPKGAVLGFRHNRFAKPAALIEFIQKHRQDVTVRPDHRVVFRQDWGEGQRRIAGVQRLISQLAQIAV